MNKCISLIQPWASMCVLGIKTVETRSFPPAKGYTGRLYIQASKRIPGRVHEKYLKDEHFRIWTNIAANIRPDFILNREELDLIFPLGSIVGHVELLPAVPSTELRDRWESLGREDDWFRECVLGDLGPDRFAWPIIKPSQMIPIPAKGTISPILWDCSEYLNLKHDG